MAPVLIVAVVLAAVMGLIGMILGGMALANANQPGGASPGTAGLGGAQDAYGNDLDAAQGVLGEVETAYEAAKVAKEALVGSCEDRLAHERLVAAGSTAPTTASTGSVDPAAELARLQGKEEDAAGAYEVARETLRQRLETARGSVDAARSSADALARLEGETAGAVQEQVDTAAQDPAAGPPPTEAPMPPPAPTGDGRVEELAARVDELTRSFPTEFPPADEIRAGYRLDGAAPAPTPPPAPEDPETLGGRAWVVVAAVDREQRLLAWEGPFELDLRATGAEAEAFEASLVAAEARVVERLGDRADEVDVVRITAHTERAPTVDPEGVKCGTGGGKLERTLRRSAGDEGDETED